VALGREERDRRSAPAARQARGGTSLMSWEVRIDKESCQSSGRCVQAAPELFRWDEDHLAEAGPAPAALSPGRLRQIARDCPAMAILLYDESGREIDPFDAGEEEMR